AEVSFRRSRGVYNCPLGVLLIKLFIAVKYTFAAILYYFISQVDKSNEKERLKMRIAVLEESVKSSEVECKASRETVLRLVAELDRERRKAASSAAALDSLKLDDLVVGRRSVEMDKETLMERLEASKRVTEAARRESSCLEKQVEELERKLRSSQGEIQAAENKLQMFLKRVAGLLCDRDCSADYVRDGYQATQLQHSTLQRAQLAEQEVQHLRESLQGLEAELLTADMHRDGLQHSKQHYEEFLEQLSETMMVDSIALDLGFDMRLNLILSRVEQLIKQEGSALIESKSLTYSLQRKLKSQKDQLESKGLHIQLLRKKVSDLEEEKRCRSSLAVERDDAHVEARKLQKKVERLQAELKAAKLSNTEPKAQLSHTNELKVEGTRVLTQSRTVTQFKMKKMFFFASVAQLLHFWMVVSQMLGLDDMALALPNYEIIKFLETFMPIITVTIVILTRDLMSPKTTSRSVCPEDDAPL
uniref:Coiled-coil domain containing 170 n=1 Tax=Echeneis naucrates TaxID=173247 RepID=A0A665XCC8_ECHNA